jgi:hypothetical protein
MWHPTSDGIAFAQKKIIVPKYVLTENNVVIGFEGPNIDILTALGNKFDYGALIKLQN